MPYLSRRDFMAHVSGGAAVIGLSHLLDPSKALASTPDLVSRMIDDQTPKQGGVLTYGQTYPNWALGQSNRGQHPYFWLDLLTRSVWSALTWVDEEMNVQLELATSLTPNEDLTVWECTIAEGVMFHDGTELTSADVIASMDFHKDAIGLIRQNVKSMEPMGRYGVRFFLENANAEFPYALAEYRAMILKAHENLEEMGFDGIGSGPFRLIDIDNARQFRAERFDEYWMGAPHLDELRGVIAMGNAAINGFRSGQLNAVWNIDPGQIGQYEEVAGQVHASAAGDQFWLIMPKNLNFPWNDVRVRKAMSLAIDRPAINRIVYNDPDGWTGNDSHMTGVNKEFVPRPVERDVAQAKALLAEAGYGEGVTLPAMVFCSSGKEGQ
ncbi:MAG: ABC transporter substrate-binding protein, partial [Pseudomonadota bacterium]